MPSSYQPRQVEYGWYDWWTQSHIYEGQSDDQRPTYVIALPPPNITGSLHIGHALTIAIQDCIIRYKRMKGFATLYLPGCDHAGISTQIVVEKKLVREQGLTKHDVGRANLIEMIWEWKEQFGTRIYTQLKRLGGSFDWTRSQFTLDPSMVDAVEEAFVRLFNDGVIYRDTKLVNWCVHLNTTLSNLEVEQIELKEPTKLKVPGYDKVIEFAVIHEFAYQLVPLNSEVVNETEIEKIVVATTRIETMLGDVAVAIHPEDAKYTKYHGRQLQHPFLDRQIPLILDSEAVDMNFGTGAVKITPAHDFNDYIVGKRHSLESINLLNDDGTYNDNAGSLFKGMKRFNVRYLIIEKLKELGLYIGKKANPMSIPICGKSKDVIEPLLKPQWWVNCSILAPPALEAVNKGELVILPKTSHKQWFAWLENIQDWCISRQLWWGHQVPAYKIQFQDSDDKEEEHWVAAKSLEEAQLKAEKKFPDKQFELIRDEDVLDTWFSSGLWPFSTLGWPSQTLDLDKFYPTKLLETGWDILFFWVARMVMMGLYLTGKLPFTTVFCHGMVRDAHGRKMSKSLGNVIDPIDVIEGISLNQLNDKLLNGNLDTKEVAKAIDGQKLDFPNGIPECGTDALRFALCAYTSSNLSLNLDILRVDGYRKFCNKLWNAFRFSMQKLPHDYEVTSIKQVNLVEKWILGKLNQCIQLVEAELDDYNFINATSAIYNFWLYEFCDVFVEAIKPLIDTPSSDKSRQSLANTLFTCLDEGLKLLHPFMPYLTEELYQRLYLHCLKLNKLEDSISLAKFPVSISERGQGKNSFDSIINASKSARSTMVEFNLIKNAIFYLIPKADHDELKANLLVLKSLIKGCKKLSIVSDPMPNCWKLDFEGPFDFYLDISGVNLTELISKREIALQKANIAKIISGESKNEIEALKKQLGKLKLISQ